MLGETLVCCGHSPLVRRTLAHKCSEGIRCLGPCGRHYWFGSFCDYRRKNILGCTGVADILAIALLRISFLVLTFGGWIWTLFKAA